MQRLEKEATQSLYHMGVDQEHANGFFDEFVQDLDRLKTLGDKARNSMIDQIRKDISQKQGKTLSPRPPGK